MLPKFVIPKIDNHVIRTINAYSKYSDKCIANWSAKPKISGLLRTIIKGYCMNNKKKLNVLDIGCGLGYDSIIFADIGKCNVYSIDACPEFLEYFKQNIDHAQKQSNKILDINVIECDFNKINENEELMDVKYDILWNNASLMHLSKDEFKKWLNDIHSVCTGNTIFGSLFFAGNLDDRGEVSNERWTDESFVPDRYLSEYTKYELSKFYTENGWRVLLMSPATEYNRKGDWIQIIAQPNKTNKL